LPLIIGALGVLGASLLFGRYRRFKDINSLILFIAFGLSSFSSLTSSSMQSSSYYLGFWFILCAILSSGCDIDRLLKRSSSLVQNSCLAGVILTSLFSQNLINTRQSETSSFKQDKRVIADLMRYCQNDSCLTLVPLHPIFSSDATRLYSEWQYYEFVGRFISARTDALSKNIALAVINSRPAVALHKHNDRFFILDLYQKRLISADEYKNLVLFLNENYTVRKFGEDSYYIRNDLI
jgi:hypothetical protein